MSDVRWQFVPQWVSVTYPVQVSVALAKAMHKLIAHTIRSRRIIFTPWVLSGLNASILHLKSELWIV
jgi:hypothetical protein